MGNQCGECGKCYRIQCQNKFKCLTHRGQCFSCRPCAQGAPQAANQVMLCSCCARLTSVDELYYDINCSKYVCRFHFIRVNLQGKTCKLPCCGKEQISQHVNHFMMPFCLHCGRKHYRQSQELSVCQPCLNKGNEESKTKQIQVVCAPSAIGKLDTSGQPSREQLNCDKCPSLPQSQAGLSKSKSLDNEFSQLTSSHNKKMETISQRLEVADFTRKEVSKIILHDDRDIECLICCQNYDLGERKPMMICLQQHLMCEKCFREKVNLKNCPMCRERIQREKIVVCRERKKTLELQDIVKKKYKERLNDFLNKNAEVIPQKSEKWASMEIQTDPQPVPGKKTRQKKKAVVNEGKSKKMVKQDLA